MGSYPEANQLLLDEFKIQEDVRMYSQLPDYDNLLGFGDIWRGGFSGDFEKNSYGGPESMMAKD